MPDTNPGREKIKTYMDKNNIKMSDLSTLYGIKIEDLSKYLSGINKSPKAIRVLTKIISDYQIR